MAKIVYFGHDLHYLSLEREYNVTRQHRNLREIGYWKKMEFDVFSKVDVVYVVSQYEIDILSEELPGKEIRFMPLFFFNSFKDSIKNFSKRRNIIFVSNFGRKPNEDAAVWFVDNVFKEFLKLNKDVVLYLVGANPTDKVSQLAGKNIVVTGYVSDNQLVEYYGKAKLAVVPLRYGAGLKGKVIEAMYHGLPIVSTEIGLEGFPGIEKGILPNNEEKAFLSELKSLYVDDRRLIKMSAFGIEYVKSVFSKRAAVDFLNDTLKI